MAARQFVFSSCHHGHGENSESRKRVCCT